jgi:hypothetical protein
MVRAIAGDKFLDHGPQNDGRQSRVGDAHGDSIPQFPADAGHIKAEPFQAGGASNGIVACGDNSDCDAVGVSNRKQCARRGYLVLGRPDQSPQPRSSANILPACRETKQIFGLIRKSPTTGQAGRISPRWRRMR